MSDARAKAEARRAKILARERKVSVSTADDAIADLAPLTSGERVERPLAARRQKIQDASEKAMEDSTGGDGKESADEPKEEVAKLETSAMESAPSSSSKKKTVQEIEAEIKQRTAEFDAKVLKEGIQKGPAKEDKPVKAKRATSDNTSSAAVIKLFRAMLIIGLGVFTGIRSIPSDPMIRALLQAKYSDNRVKLSELFKATLTGDDDSSRLEGEDFIAYQTLTNSAVKTGSEDAIHSFETERTWGRWVQKKLRRKVMSNS